MHNVNIVVYKNFKQFCTQACHSERGFESYVYNVDILIIIRIIKYNNNNHNNIVGKILGNSTGFLTNDYAHCTQSPHPLMYMILLCTKEVKILCTTLYTTLYTKWGHQKDKYCGQCVQLYKQLCTLYTKQNCSNLYSNM